MISILASAQACPAPNSNTDDGARKQDRGSEQTLLVFVFRLTHWQFKTPLSV